MLQYIFIVIARLLHRLYYIWNGHEYFYPSFSPKAALKAFLEEHKVEESRHEVVSKDGVLLRYRRLGKGKAVYILANGVGTDFFMWLPILEYLLQFDKDLFQKITLLVPSYRGLFEPDDSLFEKRTVNITLGHCVNDIILIMKDAKVDRLDGLLGWSTGAQVGMKLAAKHPKSIKSVFLLNPSCGKTLHYALQPFYPLPAAAGKVWSRIIHGAVNGLKSIISSPAWNALKIALSSNLFHGFLSFFAFMGGFPPEQPVFFHEYIRDVFHTRSQTRALFDLILSLDENMSPDCMTFSQYAVIVSGTPDFMTGVYHSQRLHKTLPNNKHVNFSMGSHFLLIEWPDLVAKEILDFIAKDK